MSRLFAIRPVTLRHQVIEQIRAAIIEGELHPDDHVTEASLTEKLGVSRVPVREALILLESEGLIVSIPNRGNFVRAFTDKDVDEVLSMRTVLENFAAEILIDTLNIADFRHLRRLIDDITHAIDERSFSVARRIDMTLHTYLIERTEHDLLIKNWSQLVAQIAALLHIRNQTMPDYPELTATHSDHLAIIEAYESRDLERVQQLHRDINLRFRNECKQALRHYSSRHK